MHKFPSWGLATLSGDELAFLNHLVCAQRCQMTSSDFYASVIRAFGFHLIIDRVFEPALPSLCDTSSCVLIFCTAQLSVSKYSETGGQVQTRLRSP